MIIPIEKKDLRPLEFVVWLNFFTTIIMFIVMIVNQNSPNKHITPDQERKLTEATEVMKEVAEFIKRHE